MKDCELMRYELDFDAILALALSKKGLTEEELCRKIAKSIFKMEPCKKERSYNVRIKDLSIPATRAWLPVKKMNLSGRIGNFACKITVWNYIFISNMNIMFQKPRYDLENETIISIYFLDENEEEKAFDHFKLEKKAKKDMLDFMLS